MESSPRWKVKTVCAVCNKQLDRFPLFHCAQKHPCCHNCYKQLRVVSKGNDSQVSCPLCRITGGGHSMYDQQQPDPDYCNRGSIRSKPGIGRPCRYKMNNTLPITEYSYSQNYQDFCTPSPSNMQIQDEDTIFETLIGMKKEDFYKKQKSAQEQNNLEVLQYTSSRPYSPKSKFSLPPGISKRPFRCPHKPCHKTVALAQFVNHFKSEHKDVQACAVERGKELQLPCDISVIEYNFHFCLAMITVYEINRIDYLRPGSSESMVRTCNKFCQKIPISTFWLMVTGSADKKSQSSYCLFWLFTNSEDSHKCTLELSSQNDSMSLSTYCGIANALDKDFVHVRNRLQCLIVTKSSLKSILREGTALNLRVTVH